MSTIAIRVSDDEHKLFTTLAERERMPLSIYVRRMLYAEAERVGLIGTQPAIMQPTTLQPPLKDTTLNNELLLKRLESGEQLTAIAQTSNLTVSEVQARIAKAKKARTDGTLAHSAAIAEFMRLNPEPSPNHKLRVSRSLDDVGYDCEWVSEDDTREQPAQPLKTSDDATESDAAHNAEIARQRLLSLGFDI
jgi:hypothetical protein